MLNSNNELPIIFFHLGNPDYLRQVIEKSKKLNSRVVLLGDETNKDLDVEHYHYSSLQSQDIEKFVKSYKHMSTNNLNFELLCFVRWFFIRNFMKNQKATVSFHADSDLLIYSDLSSVWQNFSNYKYCVMKPEERPQDKYRWSASGHSSFWTYEGICEFCDFLIDEYESPERQNQLMEKWKYHLDNNKPGGICDMTLIWRFVKHKGEQHVGMLSDVHQESTFDNNISDPNNRKVNEYEMDSRHNIKKITFDKNQPYGYNKYYNKNIKFHTLHLQGSKKTLIKNFEKQILDLPGTE